MPYSCNHISFDQPITRKMINTFFFGMPLHFTFDGADGVFEMIDIEDQSYGRMVVVQNVEDEEEVHSIPLGERGVNYFRHFMD